MRGRIMYILLLCLCISACTSDFFDIGKDPKRSGILLSFPSSDIKFASLGSTRGAGAENPEGLEGEIKKLSVYAYPTGAGGEFFYAYINEIDKNTDGKYELDIKPGNYRIYMIANMELPRDIGETDLKGRIISAESGAFASDGKLPASGIPMTASPGEYLSSADGEYYGESIEINEGELTPLYCNLRFALVKVRINILRSHAPSAKVGNISAAGESASMPLFSSFYDKYDYGSVERHILTSGGYSEYPADSNINDIVTIASLSATPPSTSEWLYQAVYYLPEKVVEDPEQMTRLTIPILNESGIEKEVSLTLGSNNDSEDGETGSELPVSPKHLLRGHLYDYTLTDSGKWMLKVSGWTQKTLVYSLSGETYLDLECSSLDMQSSEIAYIGYDTNARKIRFESPFYNNSSKSMVEAGDSTNGCVRLLLFSTVIKDGKSYIAVRVSPLVRKLAQMMTDIDNFPFTVIADGIRKEITISSLLCERFLRVFPEEIELDIAKLRSDGINTVSIPITWETNLKDNNKYQCTVTGGINWDTRNMAVTPKGPFASETEAGTTMKLTLSNIKDDEFWNTGKTIYLRYSVKSNDKPLVKEVKIRVIPPQTSNYTILFRPNYYWGQQLGKFSQNAEPHIFIYQELALPENIKDDVRRGKRVAVSSSEPSMAAYEFVFSGKIAFKGWRGFDASAPDFNDPFSQGRLMNGIFVFDNYSFDISSGSNERYVFNQEFNESLRESSICSKCKTGSSDNSLLEPGICMEKSSKEWWKYELTGIADPEKTYIRFYAAHDHHEICFPPKGSPCLRLFDFKDREGWIDINANMTEFSDDCPDKSIELGSGATSPIFWDTVLKWRYIKVTQCKNILSIEAGKIYPPTGIGGENMDMYYYFEFVPSNFADYSISYQLLSDCVGTESSKIYSITNSEGTYKVTE